MNPVGSDNAHARHVVKVMSVVLSDVLHHGMSVEDVLGMRIMIGHDARMHVMMIAPVAPIQHVMMIAIAQMIAIAHVIAPVPPSMDNPRCVMMDVRKANHDQ